MLRRQNVGIAQIRVRACVHVRTRTHTRAHDCGAGSESAACCSSIDDAVVKAAIGSPPRHSPTSCVSNHVMHANVGSSRRAAPQKDIIIIIIIVGLECRRTNASCFRRAISVIKGQEVSLDADQTSAADRC